MTSRLAPAFAPPPRDPRIAELLSAYPPSLFDERLYRSIELMERYTIDLAFDLLSRLGLTSELHKWRAPAELCRILRFQPKFESAVRWLLTRVLETGCVEASDGAFRVVHEPWPSQVAELRAIGLQIDPGNAPTLDMLDYAASLYAIVARGEQPGEEALFGPKGIPRWLEYFENRNLTYAVNNWVAAIAAAEAISNCERIRIVELGAGAGSGTEILLRVFEERNLLGRVTHYAVTEPNAFFRRRAQRSVTARYPNVPFEWAALDMTGRWRSQNVALGQFELVYGVNVLHVADDLLFTLAEARDALAPGGALVIGECLRPFSNQPMYPELVFQLLDSFSNVKLDRAFRPNAGFLTPEQWHAAFEGAGFTSTQIAPDLARIREMYPHFFVGAITARALSHANN